jgi:hypothetical protein
LLEDYVSAVVAGMNSVQNVWSIIFSIAMRFHVADPLSGRMRRHWMIRVLWVAGDGRTRRRVIWAYLAQGLVKPLQFSDPSSIGKLLSFMISLSIYILKRSCFLM